MTIRAAKTIAVIALISFPPMMATTLQQDVDLDPSGGSYIEIKGSSNPWDRVDELITTSYSLCYEKSDGRWAPAEQVVYAVNGRTVNLTQKYDGETPMGIAFAVDGVSVGTCEHSKCAVEKKRPLPRVIIGELETPVFIRYDDTNWVSNRKLRLKRPGQSCS